MLKVSCTWGDGPDVLLINEGSGYVLCDSPDKSSFKYGISKGGSIDLTAKEAECLAVELMRAAGDAKNLDRIYMSWCEENGKLKLEN